MKQQNEICPDTVSPCEQVHMVEDMLSIFLLMFTVGESENYIYQEASPGHCDEMQLSVGLCLSLN